MLSVVDQFPDYQFVIAGAPSLPATFYKPFNKHNLPILFDKTYDILKISEAALVTSGTATLETAIFKVPQVVCYKAGGITYQIAKSLIKVKYISLVNLILDKLCVTELIQNELNTNRISEELKAILGNNRNKMMSDYEELHQMLGGKGASDKTAKLMLKTLQQTQ